LKRRQLGLGGLFALRRGSGLDGCGPLLLRLGSWLFLRLILLLAVLFGDGRSRGRCIFVIFFVIIALL